MKYLNGIIDSINRASPYDPDAAAFFARVIINGGTLTNTEKSAVNTLVLSLKANSLWSSMLAIYPMVGASATACAQNLKSSSFTAYFYGGYTYANTGATPNGINGYMNTYFDVFANVSGFNNHFSVYYRTNNTGTFKIGVNIGFFDQGLSAHINFSDGNTYNDNLGRNFINNTIYGTSNAFHTSTVTSLSTQKMFRNGILKISGSCNNYTLENLNFFYGDLNQGGVPNTSFYDNREMAFGSLGFGLTDIQAATFYTTVQAFQTSLSRQV